VVCKLRGSQGEKIRTLVLPLIVCRNIPGPCATGTRTEQRSYRHSFRGNWPREPSLRIVRLMNEVVPVFSGSGSLPSHVGERQISIVSSSFPIAHNCQIKEILLDGFDLRVSHSRSGKPIKKVNQRVNRFHEYGFGYVPQNARVFGRFERNQTT